MIHVSHWYKVVKTPFPVTENCADLYKNLNKELYLIMNPNDWHKLVNFLDNLDNS